MSGKTVTMENMFEVLGNIFETMFPLNTRRSKALEMKQGKKAWSSWIADYGTAWEEAKMSKLTMDAFKAIMAIGLTDNLYIRDELLRIKPETITWAEVRHVGKEAEGCLLAKAGHPDNGMSINKVGADDRGRTDSLKRGETEIRCYRCNGKGHRLNKCHSDKGRMKCSDCGDVVRLSLIHI